MGSYNMRPFHYYPGQFGPYKFMLLLLGRNEYSKENKWQNHLSVTGNSLPIYKLSEVV